MYDGELDVWPSTMQLAVSSSFDHKWPLGSWFSSRTPSGPTTCTTIACVRLPFRRALWSRSAYAERGVMLCPNVKTSRRAWPNERATVASNVAMPSLATDGAGNVRRMDQWRLRAAAPALHVRADC